MFYHVILHHMIFYHVRRSLIQLQLLFLPLFLHFLFLHLLHCWACLGTNLPVDSLPVDNLPACGQPACLVWPIYLLRRYLPTRQDELRVAAPVCKHVLFFNSFTATSPPIAIIASLITHAMAANYATLNTTQWCALDEHNFGPRAHCRGWDFTLFFEQSVFSIAPQSLLLVLAFVRICYLRRSDVKTLPLAQDSLLRGKAVS